MVCDLNLHEPSPTATARFADGFLSSSFQWQYNGPHHFEKKINDPSWRFPSFCDNRWRASLCTLPSWWYLSPPLKIMFFWNRMRKVTQTGNDMRTKIVRNQWGLTTTFFTRQPKLQNPKSKPPKSKIQHPKFQTPKSKLKKKYPESKLPNNEWTFLCAYPRNISEIIFWMENRLNPSKIKWKKRMKKASQLFSNIQLGWRNCPVATPQNHFLAQIGEMKADHLNLWKQKLPFLKMKWPNWFWK